jgi:hypothetical protein
VKYLCLIYADESIYPRMTKEEAGGMMAEYTALSDDLKRGGHYVGSNRLQPVGTALTVRVRAGKVSTTDGPYAETKEQLGGYFLIDAKDMTDAVRLAARIPGARVGAVEVRPIAELTPG